LNIFFQEFQENQMIGKSILCFTNENKTIFKLVIFLKIFSFLMVNYINIKIEFPTDKHRWTTRTPEDFVADRVSYFIKIILSFYKKMKMVQKL